MTDTEMQRIKAICNVAGVDDIGELSDGFHTFNGLYEQRMILFAALVKAYRDNAWKSYRHEDGEYCFGGGWFIVGIDTPEGSYTYHYDNKYWDMFDCPDLPRAKHWDGHTEADAETRLMSLEPEQKTGKWIPCSERLPEEDTYVLISYRCKDGGEDIGRHIDITSYGNLCFGGNIVHNQMGVALKHWRPPFAYFADNYDVVAWMPLPEPYKEVSE